MRIWFIYFTFSKEPRFALMSSLHTSGILFAATWSLKGATIGLEHVLAALPLIVGCFAFTNSSQSISVEFGHGNPGDQVR